MRAGAGPAPRVVVGGSFVLLLLVAWVDYAAGVHLRTFPLYYVPVALASLLVGTGTGLAFAGLSAVAWRVSNQLAGMEEATGTVGAVNTGVMLVTFVVVAALTAAQRRGLERERALSRTDSLTGISNSRGFYEAAGSEVERAHRYRHPLTLAYFDLDDFKTVNDRFGHARGDQLLVDVARALRRGTRSSDVVARLGGDEFVALFPETDRAAAEAALTKLQAAVRAAAQKHRLEVGVSVGSVSFATPPAELEELVRQADRVMYEVKAAGKNAVRSAEGVVPATPGVGPSS